MKKILSLLLFASLMTACHKDDDSEDVQDPERTVLVYIAGENNLTSFAADDLKEMMKGSKSLNNNQQLIVYVDKAESTPPFFARIKDGKYVDSVSVEESITADPAILENALRYMRTNYPAKSYGLVLWGHASGWLISGDSITYSKSRAYGGDTGDNNPSTKSAGKYWMNIPPMARAIANGMGGAPLTFVMGDCCSFGCLEIAYELRNVAEYVIGSPAEVPDDGAPFDLLVPDFFNTGTAFYRNIIDHYYNYYLEAYKKSSTLAGYSLPLVAIKTSELEALATATAKLLGTISNALTPGGTFDLTNRVFYAYYGWRYSYDMYNVLKANTSKADFDPWATVFQKAVPYHLFSAHWETMSSQLEKEMKGFEDQKSDCGVVSMFFPSTDYNGTVPNWNKAIQQFQWNNVIQWQQYGW